MTRVLHLPHVILGQKSNLSSALQLQLQSLSLIFSSIFSREGCIDADVKASGLTRRMEKDLLIEMGIDQAEEEEEEDEAVEAESSATGESAEARKEAEINDLRQEVEKVMAEELGTAVERSSSNPPETTKEVESSLNERLDKLQLKKDSATPPTNQSNNEDIPTSAVVVSNSENEDVVPDLINASTLVNTGSDEESSICEFNDTRSVRSSSTVASIAPEVIKRRMQITLEKRQKKGLSRKILAKGEASATTRVRRENRDMIQQSTGCGIWGE